jgi:hypothetical protein
VKVTKGFIFGGEEFGRKQQGFFERTFLSFFLGLRVISNDNDRTSRSNLGSFQVKFLWVVMPCRAAWTSETSVSYNYTVSQPEDGGSMALRIVGILTHHYGVSQFED